MIVGCGDLTILLVGLGFHCFLLKCKEKLRHSLGRPSRSDFVQLVFYKNAGMFRILFALKDEEVMQGYVEDTVQPLLEYDALHHTDLAGVLQCYFRHDGSLQDTANELIVHRNTVNYKINKASEILKMDLTRLENRLQVMLGFGICQILHK